MLSGSDWIAEILGVTKIREIELTCCRYQSSALKGFQNSAGAGFAMMLIPFAVIEYQGIKAIITRNK
jgi:hypothetical protein